jgi:UDP-GlcNAc:undecaprenyl-phosphate/decaprenyl-phosphate GlcNAc-1-phosphate transferase
VAVRYGAVDHPNPRKVHLTPIPLWGGLAIYSGTVGAFILFAAQNEGSARLQMAGIIAAASLLVAIGVLDDRGKLHHQIKLMAAMPVASLILIAVGIRATAFQEAFGSNTLSLTADLGLTMFWVVGITAAFSILDHMDGLVAGVAAIGSAAFLLLALRDGQVLVATLAAAVLGAALGFLRWNFNPARIFMGDGGAMFLGFVMATLGLKLRVTAASTLGHQLVPVLVLAVPIFDTTLVTVSRVRRGLLPFSTPGKDHTSHRLAALGLGHRSAVLAIYLLAALAGAAAVFVPMLSFRSAVALIGVATLVVTLFIVALERTAFERQITPSSL